MRAEFIRLALRQAIDVALDRGTEVAYRARPLAGGITAADLVGWDEKNELAKPVRRRKARQRPGVKASKGAA